MSLRTKILCSFLLCIFIMFVPFLMIFETQLRPAYEQDILNQTAQLVDSKAKEVGSWLNQRISEIRIIHEFSGTQTLNFDELRPYLSSLNEVLRQQYGNPEEAFAIGGVDGHGWINDNLTIDVHQRPYFMEAMQTDQEYVISEPVISKSDEKPIFLICYPITNDAGERIGFINGSINLDKFTDILSSVQIYDGFSWIMNQQGVPYIADDDIFDQVHLSLEDRKEILKHADTAGYLKPDEDKLHTVFYASVPYAEGWLYCVQVENRNLFASFNQVISTIWAFSLFLILFATSLALWLSKSITRPIQNLQQSVLSVSKGQLDTVVETDSHDEISQLGQSFNAMVVQIKQLIDQVVQVQQQKRKAELRALQAQINPHFLYNTLDTIQWKALEHDATEVADMIYQLSQIFRISLSDGQELIALSDELQHVESYLSLQKIRNQYRFTYEIIADEKAYDVLVPKLLLQPLVENSLVHGLDRKQEDGKIVVEVRLLEHHLQLSVSDNGKGFELQQLQDLLEDLRQHKESDHYGLYNINERLYLSYGQDVTLTIENNPSVAKKGERNGCKITITLPQEESKTEN